MGRSFLTSVASFRSSASLLASQRQQLVETVPRPVGHLRSYIKDSDLVKNCGDFRVFRARTDHIVLLKGSMQDFIINEPSCMTLNIEPHDEILWPLLYNCTRYPFSYFALNKKDEIINITLFDVVYRDNSKDPLPRLEMVLSDPRDPFHLMGTVLGWAEHRHFERLGVEKVLTNEVSFVPTSLRRQKVSSTVYPPAMKDIIDHVKKYGLRWNVGVATRDASAKNVAKLGYDLPERVPKEIYKDFKGNPWMPVGETECGNLCVLDMDLARERKTFG